MDPQFSVRQALQDDGIFSPEEVEAAARNVARSLGRDLKSDVDPAMLKLKIRHLNTCFFAHWDYSIHQVLLYMDQSCFGQPALMAKEIHRLDGFQRNGGTPTKDGNIGGVSEETLRILRFFEKGAKLKKYREISKVWWSPNEGELFRSMYDTPREGNVSGVNLADHTLRSLILRQVIERVDKEAEA